MKFNVENLGYIDKGEIELNNITVICGENNVGKTYLSYSIYGFLKIVTSILKFDIESEHIDNLYENKFCSIDLEKYKNQLNNILKKASQEYSSELGDIFNTNEDFFKNSKFNFSLNNEEINEKKDFIFKLGHIYPNTVNLFKDKNSPILEISLSGEKNNKYSKDLIHSLINILLSEFFTEDNLTSPFIITSERTGISLFHRELDINKNIIVERLSKNNNMNISEMISRYPLPIKDNIDYIRDFDLINKNKSFIFKDDFDNKPILKNWGNLLGGVFKANNNEIYFYPKKESKRDKVNPIPIYMSSSSSKSLLSLDLYIKSVAQPNQILIIDEPELNLHPGKQIYMARLLAQLSNIGIKVLITTHSDFMIKEFNNLIMLSNEFKNKEKIMKKYDYDNSEVLNKDNISFYIASKDHTIKKIEVNNTGVDLESFDDVIIDINNRSDEIYYSLDKE